MTDADWARVVFDDSPTGQAAIGLDGTILLVNPRLRELCGFEDEAMPGLCHVLDVLVPSSRSSFEEHFAAAKTGAHSRFEVDLLRAGGGSTTVGVSLFPLMRDGAMVAIGVKK